LAWRRRKFDRFENFTDLNPNFVALFLRTEIKAPSLNFTWSKRQLLHLKLYTNQSSFYVSGICIAPELNPLKKAYWLTPKISDFVQETLASFSSFDR
jgi:hypothetical protein